MSEERDLAVPAVYLIPMIPFHNSHTIPFLLRKNTGYCDGFLSLPSGHVKAGETLRKALLREATEEIGITFDPKRPRLVHVLYREKHDDTGARVDFFYTLTEWEGEIQNIEKDKCIRIDYVPMSILPLNLMPHIRHALKHILRGSFESELSKDDINKLFEEVRF